jgi:arginine decarboxylase
MAKKSNKLELEARVPDIHQTLTAKYLFLTKGKGVATQKLTSFEMALRDAGIAHLNLVRVSSIFPPGCQIIPRPVGIKRLSPGQVCFVVMSDNATNEPNRLVAASVGLAVPKDGTHWGYLSEHHSFGETAKKAGEYAEDLAATMLATTLGVDFDPAKNYDERKEIYRMSGKVVTSREITQSAEGEKDGLWTTVVAAAVLLFD